MAPKTGPICLGNGEIPLRYSESLLPSTSAIIRLDLGCGSAKPGGFIGMDRMALPGVDIVADLNQGLPVAGNSVDLILASHSLEHADDLTNTVREIHRVCRHGAQVCIIAPYYYQGLNLANPYHKQGFNEHTPRFWTKHPSTPIEAEEYFHPHAQVWGLSQSDHNISEIDLRCLRMEFFYFPEYRYLSSQEQRAARNKYMNVCDQIMYHLIVIKQPISEDEMKDLASRIEYYEPPSITIRKLRERCEYLEKSLAEMAATQSNRDDELARALASLGEREAELVQSRTAIEDREKELYRFQGIMEDREKRSEKIAERLRDHEVKLDSAVALLKNRETELERIHTVLEDREKSLLELQETLKRERVTVDSISALLKNRETELERIHTVLEDREKSLLELQETLERERVTVDSISALLKTRDTELGQCDAQIDQERRTLATIQGELDHMKHKGRSIVDELDLFRNSKVTRALNRFLSKSNFRNDISPSFRQLMDDSLIFTKRFKGFRLQPSINLQRVPFVYYPLEINRSGLKGVLLAPILDLPSQKGVLGIEIVSPTNTIINQCVAPLAQIAESAPTRFDFTPIPDTDSGRFGLRVFARDADVSVRLFEWQKYSVLGFGPLKTRAFCSFLF